MRQMMALSVLLSTLLGVAGVMAGAREEVHAQGSFGCVADGPNLLENPSFEGAYSAYVPPGGHPDCPGGICVTAQMAPGWTPWWRSHDPAEEDPTIIRMPEYKPASPIFTDPVRVRSGGAAQQYFTFSSTHEAGFYQQAAVTPGEDYCFDIWGHSWSAVDDDDAYSGPDYGNLIQKVGIDPTGGTDWRSPNIVWSEARQQYDFYGYFSVSATAQAPALTVFVYSQPAWAVKHNDVYWDDASLGRAVAIQASLMVTPGSLTFQAVAGAGTALTDTLDVELMGPPMTTWTAALSPTHTLTPTLAPATGTVGPTTPLSVSVDSSGYLTGTYSATIVISTNPAVPGSPAHIPVTLEVIHLPFHELLPAMLRP